MNLRILSSGMLVIAASVLWMAAATASATTLTSPEGEIYTGNLATESEGHVVLDNPIAKIECAALFEGEIESHSESVTVGGEVDLFSFTGCTNSWHVTVAAKGSFEIHDTGGGNGTVTSSGATVEATRFGITCRYATSSTHIGTFTGGNPATLHLEAAIPFHSGSGLCGSSATNWTGSYEEAAKFHFAVEATDVEITGAQDAASVQTFGFDLGKVACKKVHTKSDWPAGIGKVSTVLPFGKPAFAECSFDQDAKDNPTIKSNECSFYFAARKIEGGSHEGVVGIRCLNNTQIEVETSKCKFTIPAQHTQLGQGLKKVTFKGVGTGANGEVTVELNLSGITYTEDGANCKNNGKVTNNGEYTGNILLKALKKAGGAQKGISIT